MVGENTNFKQQNYTTSFSDLNKLTNSSHTIDTALAISSTLLSSTKKKVFGGSVSWEDEGRTGLLGREYYGRGIL